VAAVAQDMEDREAFLADVRCRLEQTQVSQKLHYDRQHRQVSYQVGNWTLLRLRQRAASSLPRMTMGNLKPRFVGPYRVVEIINDVAVRLELPLGARLHDVFHVGVLKKFIGAPPASPPVLPAIHNGAVIPEPLRVEQACWDSSGTCPLARRAGGVCFLGGPQRVPHQVPRLSARGRAGSRGGERCHVGAHVQAPP
jgi:hypothetical protein